MTKASNGCGPECGCHVEKRSNDNHQKDKPGNSGSGKERT